MKRLTLLLLLTVTSFIQPQNVEDLIDLELLNKLPEEVQQDILSRESDKSKENILEPSLRLNKADYSSEKNEEEFKPQRVQKFGFNFFNKKPAEVFSFNGLPLHTDYILSFNDEVEVFLSGQKNKIVTTKVDLAGNISSVDFGTVSVIDLTIKEANEKLKLLISEKYIGTESYLSVKEASNKKVTIIGSVKTPGTYVVNPFISVSELIKYAQGLQDNASLRKIKVTSSTGQTRVIDLYQYLISGDRTNDISLKNGDTVFIPSTSNFFSLEGLVNRPMIYEYLSSDTFSTLLSFGDGFNNFADTDNAYYSAFQNGILETFNVDINTTLGKRVLDQIYVPSKERVLKRNITLKGNAVSGGLIQGDKILLSEALADLKYTENFYPFLFIINSFSNNGLIKKTRVFNFNELEHYKDLRLTYNDEIVFLDKLQIQYFNQLKNYYSEEENFNENLQLEDEETLEISSLETEFSESQKNNPYDPFANNFDENYFAADSYLRKKYEKFGDIYFDEKLFKLLNANTLTVIDDYNKIIYFPVGGLLTPIDIINFMDFSFDLEAKNQVKLLADSSYTDKTFKSKISNAKGAVISLPKAETRMAKVKVRGAVINPGTYLVKAGTKLEELYSLVGGFQENAFQDGILFSKKTLAERERILALEAKKVLLDSFISSLSNPTQAGQPAQIDAGVLQLYLSVDDIKFYGRVTGDLSPDSNDSKLVTVEDGDELIVPFKSDTVRIIGEVYNNTTTVYKDDFSLNEYINFAGGLKQYADISKAYIIKADGSATSIEQGLFRSDFNIIKPGDTIVIPRKIGTLSPLLLASTAIQTLSNLAFTAASLNSITN